MAKSLYHKLSLYAAVGVINLTIAAMFFVVSLKPPVLASPSTISQSNLIPKSFDLKQGVPKRIVVPNLAIDVPVSVGSYDEANDSWGIDSDHVFYAEPSVPVNNKRGNTIIYGHRLPALFESLYKITPQDDVVVFTDTGYKFNYQYVSKEDVDPSDVSIFSNLGTPKLILQTCSGSWDQYRVLYTLKLQSVVKT